MVDINKMDASASNTLIPDFLSSQNEMFKAPFHFHCEHPVHFVQPGRTEIPGRLPGPDKHQYL